LTESGNKSLIRRVVEGNRRFKQYMNTIRIGGSFGIFIGVFYISYWLLENFEEAFIVQTILVSLIITIVSFFATFTFTPKFILVFSALTAILISSFLRVI